MVAAVVCFGLQVSDPLTHRLGARVKRCVMALLSVAFSAVSRSSI
jgi:hypothetical protein